MFLEPGHTKLEVYKSSRQFVLECYKLTKKLPEHERYDLARQIRRASTSVPLNIAEGYSRKSANERSRYIEIARGSIIEIDSALDLVFDLSYCTMAEMKPVGELMIKSSKMLSGLINMSQKQEK